jgi:hypothetical protein
MYVAIVLGAAKLWQDLFLLQFRVGHCLSVRPAFSYVESIYGIFLSCSMHPLILIIASQIYDFLMIYPLFSFTLLHPQIE